MLLENFGLWSFHYLRFSGSCQDVLLNRWLAGGGRFGHHHNVNIQNAIPTSYVVYMEREMFKASRGVKKQFWIWSFCLCDQYMIGWLPLYIFLFQIYLSLFIFMWKSILDLKFVSVVIIWSNSCYFTFFFFEFTWIYWSLWFWLINFGISLIYIPCTWVVSL